MASLVVGGNSYMTLAEAETLMSELFISSSDERKFWGALADEDKIVIILNGTVTFESLIFLGKKKDAAQPMSFPRMFGIATVEVDNVLKKGILELSILSSYTSAKFESKLRELGIKSYNVEGASMSFQDNSSANNSGDIDKKLFRKYFSRYTF